MFDENGEYTQEWLEFSSKYHYRIKLTNLRTGSSEYIVGDDNWDECPNWGDNIDYGEFKYEAKINKILIINTTAKYDIKIEIIDNDSNIASNTVQVLIFPNGEEFVKGSISGGVMTIGSWILWGAISSYQPAAAPVSLLLQLIWVGILALSYLDNLMKNTLDIFGAYLMGLGYICAYLGSNMMATAWGGIVWDALLMITSGVLTKILLDVLIFPYKTDTNYWKITILILSIVIGAIDNLATKGMDAKDPNTAIVKVTASIMGTNFVLLGLLSIFIGKYLILEYLK